MRSSREPEKKPLPTSPTAGATPYPRIRSTSRSRTIPVPDISPLLPQRGGPKAFLKKPVSQHVHKELNIVESHKELTKDEKKRLKEEKKQAKKKEKEKSKSKVKLVGVVPEKNTFGPAEAPPKEEKQAAPWLDKSAAHRERKTISVAHMPAAAAPQASKSKSKMTTTTGNTRKVSKPSGGPVSPPKKK